MNYLEILLNIIIVIGVVEFTFGFMITSGLRSKLEEYFVVKRPMKRVFKMLKCNFCLTFWICISVYLLTFIPGISIVLIPLSAFGWYWIFNNAGA